MYYDPRIGFISSGGQQQIEKEKNTDSYC